MNRVLRLLSRFLRGEDVILVSQSKEHWNRQFADGKWDRLVSGQANTSAIAERVFQYLEEKRGRIRVLDIGCGNGGLAKLLTQEPRIMYTGIDIADTAISKAKELAPAGTFVVADAHTPPHDTGEFDVLIFNEVFFYMNPKALLNYKKHAAPNARVLISLVRSWRTLSLLRRIRHFLHIETRFSVGDEEFRWDILTGRFI